MKLTDPTENIVDLVIDYIVCGHEYDSVNVNMGHNASEKDRKVVVYVI